MSKAFTKEPEDDLAVEAGAGDEEPQDSLPPGVKNYMTPRGFSALETELRVLQREERPKIVEVVAWAAGNGDRSENGDYLYGKKRLREIDRRIRFLLKRLETAEVVDPRRQKNLTRVFFGATVTYARADGTAHTVRLVGPDEADPATGTINWLSPVARALMKAEAGDTVTVRHPDGSSEMLEILAVRYES